MDRAHLPGPAYHELRRGARDLQGGRPAGGRARSVLDPRSLGHPCGWPYPHGHRECGDDRRRPSVQHRRRSVPRAQRLVVEPSPAPRVVARARRHPLSDRKRQRGRGGLSHMEAAPGCDDCRSAGGGARRSGRLLYVRDRDARGVLGAARSDRVQAGGARGDRRLGCDGIGVPGACPSTRRRGSNGLGAEARYRVQLGGARKSWKRSI